MNTYKKIWQVILWFLLLVATALLIWFIVDLVGLYKTGNLKPTRGFSRSHTYRQTLTPDKIEGWMTFSYINYIFNLSPNYLKDSLKIEDNHYPNLGIDKYARSKNIDPTSFIVSLRKYVAQYNKNFNK